MTGRENTVAEPLSPEPLGSPEYNRGWADGNASVLDACAPVIERLQGERDAARRASDAQVAELREALLSIAYWHRAPDEAPAPDGCRTCGQLALAGIPLDPPRQPDPARDALAAPAPQPATPAGSEVQVAGSVLIELDEWLDDNAMSADVLGDVAVVCVRDLRDWIETQPSFGAWSPTPQSDHCPDCGHPWRHHGRGGPGEECIGRRHDGGARCGCRHSLAAPQPATPLFDRDLLERLVTLVRFGFLVTIGGERATIEDVGNDRYRALLLTIISAKDVDDAVARLAEPRKETGR